MKNQWEKVAAVKKRKHTQTKTLTLKSQNILVATQSQRKLACSKL